MQYRYATLLVLASLLIAGCRTAPQMQPAAPPLVLANGLPATDGDAYIGLSLRDYEGDGAVVSWVLPGPLEGTGFRSPYLNRGDLVLAVDGVEVKDPEHFAELIKGYRPGDTIALTINRTDANLAAAVPTPGEKSDIQELPVTLVAKHLWTGPIFASTPESRVLPTVVKDGTTPLESYLRDQLAQHDLTEPVTTLMDLFTETVEERGGYHMLSRVNYGFRNPMHFPELCREVTDPLTQLHRDPAQVLVRGAILLDVEPPALGEPIDLSDPSQALAELAMALVTAEELHRQAFAEVTAAERKLMPEAFPAYMKSLSPFADNPASLITSMRATMRIDFAALFASAASFSGVLRPATSPAEDSPTVPLPRELEGLVTGDILGALQVNGQWLVYGGFGDNTYNASKLAIIIDAGGNDTYTWEGEERPELQVIVDLAGNDTYTGSGSGPAAATLGVNILVDHAGNDSYTGEMNACGAAVAGIGILLDMAGNDTYRGTSWSLGSAFYGMGAIIDLGGNDIYWGHHACQGIGGPRGFGLIHDRGGNDLYRANGPTGSAYGTPAVYYGLSQGVGFGVRGFDSGGIGILQDMSGNDRYEAGEFSQGGGYYWALGILDDRQGNDLYYGNRYAQGFGCHQALGALLDHAGNDTYWAMTAAAQGAAWDIGMGLLMDYKGNDTYSGPGLSQGGAAMQGIAWLIDWEGDDHYTAAQHGTHGMSSGNSYHYDRTKAMSWALFLDAGGTHDYYSTGRQNGTTESTGSLNEEKPEDSRLYGLFIDTAEKLELK